MAYSNWGGYAYRNGKRIVERSDCTIDPNGDLYSTPGTWPGFGMLQNGVPYEDVIEQIKWPNGHVVLGDGPFYLVLYKNYGMLYKGPERIDFFEYQNLNKEPWARGKTHRKVTELGDKITVVLKNTNGSMVAYAKIVHANGTKWHGFSGMSIGAGFENEEASRYHTLNTNRVMLALKEMWPESINGHVKLEKWKMPYNENKVKFRNSFGRRW